MAEGSYLDAYGLHHHLEPAYGQTHYVEEIAVYALDEHGGSALGAIRACLVQRFTQVHIVPDLCIPHTTHSIPT